ncbi:MFS transporter [Pseudonocardiaceae bacterium YIM PH 21723]|nr:MFS transporter [Pseudonocardiaceae bacterium YIM PH 21723]
MTSTKLPGETPITPTASRRAMLGLGLGNTLEWFDWMVFGLLSSYIGANFFPPQDPIAATLGALAIFGAGFAARPLGGAFLGLLADRVGRRAVMLLSVTIMTVGTLVIALIPTYADIGVTSTLILLVCRLLQGIAVGVEAPLATSCAIELSPPGREGKAAGFVGFYVNLGILAAAVASFCTSLAVSNETMQDWGWRVPFAVGAVLGIFVIQLRRSLPETLRVKPDRAAAKESIWGELRRHWLSVLAIIFVCGAAQAFNYAWTTGLPNLARSGFHEPPTAVFAITALLGLIQLIGSPLTGMLADRKRLSRTFVVTRLLSVPAGFLALAYNGPGLGLFTLVMLVGGVVLVLNLTLYNVVSLSLLPESCRVTGVGFGYGIGVAVFGGTASYLVVWLQQMHLPWAFPLYTAVLSALSVVLYLAARRSRGTYAGE